jgi:hypothetical protein
VTDDVNEEFGTNIQIDRIGLNWKGEVDIRNLYIEDHHKDTLIFSEKLQTSILSAKRLIDGNLDFGYAELYDTKFYLKTYQGEVDDNLTVFTNKFESEEPPSSDPFELIIDEVSLVNTRIKIIDENLETPVIFDFNEIYLSAEDFKVLGPVITSYVDQLSLKEARGIEIKDLQAEFTYTPENLILNDLTLITDSSTIHSDIKMSYGEKGMVDFKNNVTIKAQFDESVISTNDINAFYDEFEPNRKITLLGDFEGILNDFTFKNTFIESWGIRILGDYSFMNLLSEDEDFLIIAANHIIYANNRELKRLMPRVLSDLPDELRFFGDFKLTGNTSLTSTNLETESSLSSPLGLIEANVTLTGINEFDNASYLGNLKLIEFDLGRLAKSESLGAISSDLEFDGSGFSQVNVNTGLSGIISSFSFEDYEYKNITVSGNLKNPIFDGELHINDPNLKMVFRGLLDVSKKDNKYDFEANVEFAELNRLNLIKRDSISIFAGDVIMDMYGTTINDATGNISFKQTFYQNEIDDFYFDDFNIESTFVNDIRTIRFDSPDIIDGTISGKFLVEDIPSLFRNAIGSIYTNYKYVDVTNNQYIDYDFKIFNKIVDVFVPELQFGENTIVKGSVFSEESKFILNFKSPEILVLGNYLGMVNLQVDNDNPLYNTYLSVDSIYNGYYDVIDLNMINKTINDTLYIRSEFKGGKERKDLYNLSLYHTINPEGKSVVGVKRSDITFKENVWYLNENNNNLNKVVFDIENKNFNIKSLVLNHNKEIIEVAGSLRDSTYKNINLNFRDVNIGNITPEVDSLRLNGNVNGRIDFIQKGARYYPKSTVTIDNLNVNDVKYGDFNLNIRGNEDLTIYKVNTSLINENVKSFSAVGDIDVSDKETELRLNVDLNNFNLSALSPFGEDVITNIRGFMSGNARVTGNINSPDVMGVLDLDRSGLKIPYLNTDFDLVDGTRVLVSNNKFDLGTTTITDTKYNTSADLSGSIAHNNFKDWALDLYINSNNLLVLDTPPDEDELYYGTAFISGTADINGPVNELVIDVVAATEEGTSFKIPLSDAESIGDDSFIKFLSPDEKEAKIRGETVVSENIKGLTLNFELDINKNAEVEVVIDQVNRSTLKGRGAGTLLLEINTLGKFNMWGDFIVYEGIYNFRYGRLIRKEIKVVRDGTITWDGNPSEADLNLRAIYETKANPSVLLDNPSINRKIPVNVIVNLSGEILKPDLNFDIDFPDVSTSVRNELEYKLQNSQQRETQALFLIASGSFVSDNAAGQNAISSTLTEGINAMVAEIFSNDDSRVKVLPYYDIGNKTVDQETADELGFAITTQISERIIIDGKVGIPVGGVNETSVAGDVEVQWLVNEDGSLRINFFNRQAEIQFIGEDQIFEQGAGISYSVDFDEFKDLIKKLFGKNIELDEKNDEEMDTKNLGPVNFISKPKKDRN